MNPLPLFDDPQQVAAEIAAEIRALPVQSTPAERAIRRKYSRKLNGANPEFILDLARELLKNYGYRGVPYELIENHSAQGINSWWSVDLFARILAGPAWLRGQVTAELIHKWAHSPDRWWRRAALVSTVALNMRSHGGQGDAPRTLAVCRLLVADHDDMVLKAMSWALRMLVPHDPDAVREFIGKYEDVLAARVKREVRNKLATGLKNPRRKKG
jgi:3-methyladenine DNA glycosylase AlkD